MIPLWGQAAPLSAIYPPKIIPANEIIYLESKTFILLLLLCSAVLAHIVSEDGEHVSLETLEALITACDSAPSPCSAELASLFKGKVCSIDSFQQWILANPDMASFSRWLLTESSGMDLEGEADSLTFYQTLSQWYNGEYGAKLGCGGVVSLWWMGLEGCGFMGWTIVGGAVVYSQS